MQQADPSSRQAMSLATVDTGTPVWIHQIPYPLLRHRYAKLGLVRGIRVTCVQRNSDQVYLELPGGRTLDIPFAHAHCFEVLQVIHGGEDPSSAVEPVGIGGTDEGSVYWIGTDPASLPPASRGSGRSEAGGPDVLVERS